ncbi:serine/arginine repetitive matrix protein 2-like isoform X3 [Littorina saxatilis]|uniref:serine/arginine repetitive matrix protein 2-like isoform X3 n=1 Tax=Littorina saxatilis TaxID=31220 RepID=UPI0038B5CC82
MSVLQVYMSWANSLLCENNRSVDNVAAVQDGKVLCELIDILAPDAGLVAKVQASSNTTQRAFVQSALDHMKNHGIKITFSAQDIIDGDIKSLLDVMWLLILNYGIHYIGTNSFQRSVGVAKKSLLDWCQWELEVAFDAKNTLAFSLCTGNWFTKLLRKFAGHHIDETEEKVGHLYKLLQEIEERYGVRRTVISPNDIIDGTVDEHTLMIYLSLLKRRVCTTARSARREMYSVDGKEAAMAREERNRSASEEVENRRGHSEAVGLTFQQQQQQQQMQGRPKRSSSADSSLITAPVRGSVKTRSQESVESDLFSSDTNSMLSGRDRSPGERGTFLINEAEQVLMQTISERVKEHLPTSDRDKDKDTDASQGPSERETESMSDFSSGALDEGYFTVRSKASNGKSSAPKPKEREQTAPKRPGDQYIVSNGAKKPTGTEPNRVTSARIKIKRPTDYYLQWEETIDRLSQGPLTSPDVSDMSPRSPRQILQGINDIHSPQSTLSTQSPRFPRHNLSRSTSRESEVYGRPYEPVWKRREHFEKRPSSLSPGGPYRKSLYADRSSSLPEETTQPSNGRSGERRQSPSPSGRSSGHANRPGEAGKSSGDRRNPTENQQQRQGEGSRTEPSTQALEASSTFMERLEELKRSGRAQRVILPDLGPDAPVLMIPGQGEEVLLLFDALRQARLEVNLKMPKENDSRSPSRTSPTQQPSDETDPKKVVKVDKAGAASTRKSPTQEEESDSVRWIPRPTPHRHRVSKPTDIRIADLRSGRVRDQRRTQSLSERQTVSPLVPASDASRYHSLSPRREQVAAEAMEQLDSLARQRIAVREASLDRMGGTEDAPFRRVKPPNVDALTSPMQRSYTSSPVAFRASPSSSTYRQAALQTSYHSPGPLRVISPRRSPSFGGTHERLPPLELPEDLLSPRRSPSPRVGGQGRVPRREAWERQRQVREPRPYVPGATDSLAQAKFIEVLCKEIEGLKQKIEGMEDSSPERRSASRGRSTSYTTTSTGQANTYYTSRSEIQETDSKMLLAPKDGVTGQRFQHSPRPWEATRSGSSPPRSQSGLPSVSPRRQYGRDSPNVSRTRGRQSPSPDRSQAAEIVSPRRRAESETALGARASDDTFEKAAGRASPRSGRAISLGYKSPIRSVTQEIWGKDLSDVEGLEPGRRDNYKRLISQRTLAEEDVIELKQALASSVVENDILQAKLSNARHEIQEKLSKTNEVLDDCRRHLAKSQAENMELRTALEREKVRSETSEGRGKDLELLVKQARADNEELKGELEHTLSILDRSKSGIDALKQENAHLRDKASFIQNDNSSLKREMDDLKKSHFKSVNTTRELRNCLDDLRQERNEMQHKVNRLERSQNEQKVKSIISNYNQEKGAKDEKEAEYNSSSGVSSVSERFRSASATLHRSSTRNEELLTPRTTPSKSAAATPNVSGITPLPPSPGRGLNYSFNDLSPTVPSSYREIYPHRKPRYRNLSAERYGSPERQGSPVAFIDYPDLEHYPTKLDSMNIDDRVSDEVPYGRPRSRDSSPIQKPVPYRPYSTEGNRPGSSYTMISERTVQTTRESRARSPQTRGRSPVRVSQRPREARSSSCSPARGLSNDRLNRSYDSVLFERKKQRSASTSPGRFADSRRGILKNGTSSVGRARDRSCSPRYTLSRSHSPPTRLSPEDKTDNGADGKKLMFTRTEAGQIARNLQREFDKEDCLLDEMRKKHTTKSWFELQLDDTERPTGVELADSLGEEHLLLSDEQRNYANQLIKKYTGLSGNPRTKYFNT